VAAFSLGHVPTGSGDPFGLRRAATGVVALLRELPASLGLSHLVERVLAAFAAEEYYRAAGPLPPAEVRESLLRFFRPRLEAVLEEEGARPDLVEAVLGAGLESVPRAIARAAFLQARAGQPDWQPVVQT